MSSPIHSPPAKKKKTKQREATASGDESPRKKKQKTSEEAEDRESAPSASQEASTRTSEGRHYTLSMALPGSIIANAQSLQLKSYLAGQIARTLAVFSVDEIVIFDETMGQGNSQENDPNAFLGLILQYLEIPQYLRKSFVPHHPDLRFAGLLNPLDSPHHMRIDEVVEYREGVVLDRPAKAGGNAGSYVNCGMRKDIRVNKVLQANTRVTVRLDNADKAGGGFVKGVVVPPSEPRTARGLYWGYSVRFAESLSSVFSECPYKGGYDMTIGTSERGENIDEFKDLPTFKNGLVVFGGVKGLEYSLETDESLRVGDVSELFQFYFNTCPTQGSRTIRTEEAIVITMAALRPKLGASGWSPC